jgi:hypothetical protein
VKKVREITPDKIVRMLPRLMRLSDMRFRSSAHFHAYKSYRKRVVAALRALGPLTVTLYGSDVARRGKVAAAAVTAWTLR